VNEMPDQVSPRVPARHNLAGRLVVFMHEPGSAFTAVAVVATVGAAGGWVAGLVSLKQLVATVVGAAGVWEAGRLWKRWVP
jgi:hypothetical protein